MVYLESVGELTKLNQLAVRINQLIADNQGNALTHLVHATPKQLWAAVKPKRPKVDNELILDPDLVNNFFAKIPTDPDYSIDNVLKFKKDINGPDFSQGPEECITCYAMEEILRNVKNAGPHQVVIRCQVGYFAVVLMNLLSLSIIAPYNTESFLVPGVQQLLPLFLRLLVRLPLVITGQYM